MEQQKPLNGKQLIDLLTSSVVDEDVLVDYPVYATIDIGFGGRVTYELVYAAIVASEERGGEGVKRSVRLSFVPVKIV